MTNVSAIVNGNGDKMLAEIRIPKWLWALMLGLTVIAGGWAIRVERQLGALTQMLESKPYDERIGSLEARVLAIEQGNAAIRMEWSHWRGGVQVKLDEIIVELRAMREQRGR